MSEFNLRQDNNVKTTNTAAKAAKTNKAARQAKVAAKLESPTFTAIPESELAKVGLEVEIETAERKAKEKAAREAADSAKQADEQAAKEAAAKAAAERRAKEKADKEAKAKAKAAAKAAREAEKERQAAAVLPYESRVSQYRAAGETLAKMPEAKAAGLEFYHILYPDKEGKRTINRGDFVLRLPAVSALVKLLPQSDDAKAAIRLVKSLRDGMGFFAVDYRQTVIFRRRGAVNAHGRIGL